MTRVQLRTVLRGQTMPSSVRTLVPSGRLVAALATVGLVLILLPERLAHAAEITVTSTSGTRGGPGCTLRDAITAANTDVATGGCPAGSGADTIVLTAAATYTLTEVDNTTVRGGTKEPNGLPSVTTDITIIGKGATVARSNANGTLAFRLLHVAPDGRLTINDATLTNGMPATQPGPGGDGGGILNEGVLTLINVTVVANSAGYASLTETVGQPPVAGCAGRGGGVFNAGTLTLTGGSVSFNHAGSATLYDGVNETCPGEGGGVYNDTAATLTLNGTTVSGNGAGSAMDGNGADGGGIFNAGNLVITNSAITNNAAGYSHDSDGGNGGGISNAAGSVLTLTDSTVSENQAGSGDSTGGSGGGIFNLGSLTINRCTVSTNGSGGGTGDGNGGGLANGEGGTLTLINTTVSGNQAGNYHGEGGGIFNAGSVTIVSSTISRNSMTGTGYSGNGGGLVNAGSPATVRNTVIAGNSSAVDWNVALPDDCYGVIASQGYNLVQDASNCTITGDTTGNVIGVDPHLGPLQSNGGLTETQALLPGSPAIDAGDPNGCTDPDGNVLTTDQRGAPRAASGDDRCDIGAYETTLPAWATITPTPTSTPPPTSTPTITVTPTFTPTATPTWAIAVDVGTATGLPGQQVAVEVFLRSKEQNVAGIQNDIAFDPSTPIAGTNDGAPACTLNPAIHKVAAFAPRCNGLWPHSCSQVRALLFPLDDLRPIPDGSLLYTCTITVSSRALPGTFVLSNSGVIASDPTGRRLEATGGADGSIIVLSEPSSVATTTPSPTPTAMPTDPGAAAVPTPANSPPGSGAPAAASSPDAPAASGGCSLVAGRDPASAGWLVLLPVAALLARRRRFTNAAGQP